MLALGGVRILDLTEALAGPYCTMLLGDLGADVVKIERPGAGDQSRAWGARLPQGESAYFCSTNRNKRSLTLNIQTAAGREVMQRLLASADVFICNIPRLASLRKVGLDPDRLRAQYPRLIYASITGYGRSGPYADRSGYDLVAQGEAGLMSLTGDEATAPLRYPVPLADMTTGLYTALGILAALLVRGQTGQGQVIDMSLLESQAAWLTILAGDYFVTGAPPRPLGNQHPAIVPYQVFRAADRALIVAVGSDKQWGLFCEALGWGAEVRDDPRFATNQARLGHRDELTPMIEAVLVQRPATYWLERLRAAEIPCGPINSVPDILADPHYCERGNLVELDHAIGRLKSLANPVRLSDTPATYRLPPPRLGEHSDAILTDLGYTGAEIAGLRAAGAV